MIVLDLTLASHRRDWLSFLTLGIPLSPMRWRGRIELDTISRSATINASEKRRWWTRTLKLLWHMLRFHAGTNVGHRP